MSTKRKTTAAPKKERETTVPTVKQKVRVTAKPKAVAKEKTGGNAASAPAAEQIASLAYELWEQAGRPEGRSEEHWREAEARLGILKLKD
jgi:hypothetical protein